MKTIARNKGYRVHENTQVPNTKETPCIIGLHPHGRYPMSVFPTFETRPDLFGENDFVMAQSSLGKFVPTVGYITMLCGRIIDASTQEITNALLNGKHVGLMPGGAKEMTYCTPGGKVIPLVPHSGFLRLSWKLSNEKKISTGVIPCFVFGLHDSYWNPLSNIDRILYHSIGMNLPLWLPTDLLGAGTCIVMSKMPMNPMKYDSVEDFIEGYYQSVKSLFYEHRRYFPAYQGRDLKILSSNDARARTRGTRSKGKHIFITFVKVTFLILFIVIFTNRGHFIKLSTSGIYATPNPTLVIHIVAATIWTFVSAGNTTIGFHKLHRIFGYIAISAMTIMSGTGFRLAIEMWRDQLKNKTQQFLLFHVFFHSFSNLHIAAIIPLLLGFALVAAYEKDITTHARYTSIAHILVGVSFIPRVTRIFFQWLLPFWWMDEHFAFTLAAMLNWSSQLSSVWYCQNDSLRHALGMANIGSVLVTILTLVWEWEFGYPFSSVFWGPVASMLIGVGFNSKYFKGYCK